MGKPIDPTTGDEFEVATDYASPLPGAEWLSVTRTYNSSGQAIGWTDNHQTAILPPLVPTQYSSSSSYSLGPACSYWSQVVSQAPAYAQNTYSQFDSTNYVCNIYENGTNSFVATMRIVKTSTVAYLVLNAVILRRANGDSLVAWQNGSSMTLDPSEPGSVSATSSGYQYVTPDNATEVYDSNGNLLSVTEPGGSQVTLSYANGALSSVQDAFGHALSYAYDGQGRIATITLPDNGQIQYAYDSANRLSTVTYPDNSSRTYLYEDAGFPSALTGIVDESGNRYATWSYDDQGRAISSQLAGGAEQVSVAYNGDNSSTMTDAFGTAHTFTFQSVQGQNRVTALTLPCSPSCGDSAAETYDANGNVSSKTDFNGNVTQYSYDLSRDLETSRTEAYGTPQARTVTTQWLPNYRLPTLISVYAGGTATGTRLRTTSFTYDGAGNLLTRTVADPATDSSRTWTYTYDSYGRMLTADGPRTDVSDVTTYTYYTCTTGYQCGELETVTDPLGHVTTYSAYDGNGRPLTITDPNGTVTTLAYDARGRLKSRTVAGETTSLSYYPTGLLQQVTLPDGGSLSYSYDAAHRLTGVSDGLGNKIVYTLDAMGNRTAANSYDPSGTLHRTHARVINAVDEISQEINAAGNSAVTTTFGYDNDGNRTSTNAPLSRNTTESYDALNRVSSITVQRMAAPRSLTMPKAI